jgi:hypothetical protein
MTDRIELIDQYAGLAMQAAIGKESNHFLGTWDNENLKHIAKLAYAMAVAMHAEKTTLLMEDLL